MLRRFQLTENAALSPEEQRAPGPRAAGREVRVGPRSRAPSDVSAEALVFATAAATNGRPAAVLDLLGTTALGRLLGQLGSVSVPRAWVITRPEWRPAVEKAADGNGLDVTVVTSDDVGEDLRLTAEIADRARGPMIVANAHILVHREALAGLLADPRIASGILSTGSLSKAHWSFPIRSERARVVSAASPYHRVSRPTGYFLGLVKVDARDRDRLVTAASELAALAAARPEQWDAELERKTNEEWRLQSWCDAVERKTGLAPEPADAPDLASAPLDAATEADLALRRRVAVEDPVPLILVGLVRAEVDLFPSNLRDFFHATPVSTEDARRASEDLASSDEDQVLLDAAVKGNDGFFTTFFVSPYSKYLARFAARRGWTPNAVSTVSLAIGAAAAASFAVGSRASLIAGALLLQISFTVDCVDGQLARYTRTFSKLGGWIDSVFDRTKEYLVYAGLALGSVHGFGDDVWLLAGAALALQTVRHMSDFAYVASQRQAIATTPRAPLDRPEDVLHVDRPEPSVAERVALPAGASPRQRLLRLGVRAARALRRSSVLRWGNRIVRLPIGERFALISLTAAIATPRVTFIALLSWGAVAAVYAVGMRILVSYAVPRRFVRAVLG